MNLKLKTGNFKVSDASLSPDVQLEYFIKKFFNFKLLDNFATELNELNLQS